MHDDEATIDNKTDDNGDNGVDDGEETEEGLNVVYVKEKPFKRIAIIVVASIVAAAVLLFVIGLIMGFMGKRPPVFDSDGVLRPKTETSVVQTAPTQTTPPPNKKEDMNNKAYIAGKEAGGSYKKYENDGASFWRGFNEAGP